MKKLIAIIIMMVAFMVTSEAQDTQFKATEMTYQIDGGAWEPWSPVNLIVKYDELSDGIIIYSAEIQMYLIKKDLGEFKERGKEWRVFEAEDKWGETCTVSLGREAKERHFFVLILYKDAGISYKVQW